jgi:hypothetical protein
MGDTVHKGRRYSWNDEKRRTVKKKHGIDLADIPQVFDGPTLETEAQDHEVDGLRMKILGLSQHNVVVVVYTELDDGAEYRLITAWHANRLEQSLYYETLFGEKY